MKTIQELSPHIIAKIAAGEVVKNPASIVKELVENSLDAGATVIEIDLTKGGLERINIKDNGRGMSKEDLEVCFLPHTTSKITVAEDLFSLSSFGFRGEAIWSIASVSTMQIQSRQPQVEYGHELILEEGKIVEQRTVGIPEGTNITISNLFKNTPARRKFLKDFSTETRNVVDVILQFALCFPQISFKLKHNTRLLLSFTNEETSEIRLRRVLGEYMALHSIPLAEENRFGKISGYIGRPQISGRTRAHQYLFVNNRPVSPLSLSKYISLAFGNLIEPRSYPVFIIFLEIPSDHLDVNIHPQKEEVAFLYEQEIASLLQEAITKTLKENNLTFQDVQEDTSDFKGMDRTTASLIRTSVTPWNVKNIPAQEIVQINNLYLIAPTDKGIFLVDQHAAHERILYEQFLEVFTSKQQDLPVYELPESYIFELPYNDALVLIQKLDIFQKIGFEIEQFGERTFKVCAIPEIFKERDYVAAILEVVQQIKEYGDRVQEHILDKQTDRTLSFLACRTAIKGGDALTHEERKRLVEKLLEVSRINTAYTCPHGRPTHIEISLGELDRLFKRK